MAALAAITVLAGAGSIWRLWQQDYFWRNPLDGAKVERLTDFEGEETHAVISPDGRFLTFLSDRNGSFDAWISQIGSGEFSNITQGRFQLMNNPSTPSVGFSGDGAQVWFMQLVTPRPLRWTSWISPVPVGAPRPFVEGGLDPIGRRMEGTSSTTPTSSETPFSSATRTEAVPDRSSWHHRAYTGTICRGRPMAASSIW